MKTLRYDAWNPFRWHGLGLEIPADWNPGKLVGDWKSGNVRLDGPVIPRVELEWKQAHGDDRVNLIVDRYVEGLAKGAEKKKQRLSVDRAAECPGLALSSGFRAAVYFVWRSQYFVHTLACYSAASDRLVFIRVMAKEDEDLSAILPRVLNSLSDAEPDTARQWALFDLTATSPAGYDLDTSELKSGHIRLKFVKDRDIYQVDRLSLARMLLQRRSLEDWYREFFRKDLRHINVTAEPGGAGQAPTLTIGGTPRSRLRGLLMPLPFWSSRPRMHLAGRAWVAEEANKILVVQSFHRRPADSPDIDAFARTVVPLQ